MEISRQSPITGRSNTLEIPISEEDFISGICDWKRGAFIQDAFPDLAPKFREFIMSGITPEEWDKAFIEE